VLPLYRRPNVSASHVILLKNYSDLVCLSGCRRPVKDPRDPWGTLPCVEAIARTASLPPPQTANLNQPRSISKYDKTTALMLVSSKLMNKNPVESNSH